MSNDREAARALNSFARESFDLLGGSDGPALADFLQDYFCGEDANESPGTRACIVNRPVHCMILYPMLFVLLVDEEDYCESDGSCTK